MEAATLNNRDGRALGKCPVDIFSEGATLMSMLF